MHVEQDTGGLNPDALDGVRFGRVDLVDAHIGLDPSSEVPDPWVPARGDQLLGEILHQVFPTKLDNLFRGPGASRKDERNRFLWCEV